MNIEQQTQNGQGIALVYSPEPIILNGQTALDFLAQTQYDTGCRRIVVNKACLVPEFFTLRTGIAGDVLQKFINYNTKLAIYGDFTKEAQSKPLHDFMYESNQGNDIFFAATKEEAVERIARAR